MKGRLMGIVDKVKVTKETVEPEEEAMTGKDDIGRKG